MINASHKVRNLLHIKIVLSVLWLFLFTACTKDPGVEETGVSLRFINASPDAAPIQFNLNGQRAYTPALAFGDTTAYLTFNGGTYAVTSDVGIKTVVNTVIDFIPKKHYTLFMVDSASKTKLAVYKDDLDVLLAPLRINVRFLNLIPDAPALALFGISQGDTIQLSSGKSFDTRSTDNDAIFSTYPATVYELLIVSATKIIARLPAKSLYSNKFYTVFARGFINGTANQAAAAGIIQHN